VIKDQVLTIITLSEKSYIVSEKSYIEHKQESSGSRDNLDETSWVIKNSKLSMLNLFVHFTTISIIISTLNRKKKKINHPEHSHCECTNGYVQ